MTQKQRTGIRELLRPNWYREHVPSDGSWSTINCCHYCHYCHSLLALFSSVPCADETDCIETCRRQPAANIHRVGAQLQVPIFRVAHTGDPLRVAAVQRLGHPEIRLFTSAELASFIDKLHDCEFCRRHQRGRFAVQQPPSVHEGTHP